jgi:hypothetical protein
LSQRARIVRFGAGVAVLLGLLPSTGEAQVRLVDRRTVSVSPAYVRWSFETEVEADSLAVTAVDQLSIPFALSFSLARNWRLDASAAYTRGTVTATGASGAAASLSIDGLTDAKLRLVGRMARERLWLTLGVNLPTGHTALSNEEAAAIRVVGAPALRMTTPVLGSGTGFTAGMVYTLTAGRWAVGLGASFELRGTYTPLDATLAGGTNTVVDLDPAKAVHLSIGIDGIVGQGRMSLLVAGDAFGTDLVTIRSGDGATQAESEYRFGPTLGVSWQYRLATARFRELRFSTAVRHRSAFEEGDGGKVSGSSGTVVNGAIAATIGGASGVGIVLGLDGFLDSGLEVDNTVATAAMTSAAFTLGLELPRGQITLLPFVRGTLGRLDSGATTTTATALAAGIAVSAEW